MPCNTIDVTKVKFSLEHTNMDLFKQTMTNLGYNQQSAFCYVDQFGNTAEFTDGKLTQRFRYGRELKAEEIKQEYGRQVVKFAAKKMRWNIEEETPLKGRLKKRF